MKKTLSIIALGFFMAGCAPEPIESINDPMMEEPVMETGTEATDTFGETTSTTETVTETDTFGETATVAEEAAPAAETQTPMHASVMAPPVGVYKIGNAYNVDGETYTPSENYTYSEEGTASWYGTEFEGQKTANGEIFNPNLYTAAHKTMPLPSVVRVTNLENNKSVVVRVNDRGPFTKDRLIDVSEVAAAELGFKDKGTTRVRMEVLPEESRQIKELAIASNPTANAVPTPIVPAAEPVVEPIAPAAPLVAATTIPEPTPAPVIEPEPVFEPTPTPAPAPAVMATGAFKVQAGAFNSMENATVMQNQISSLGASSIVEKDGYFKIHFGPFKTKEEASAMAAKLRENGINPGLIKDGRWASW